MFWLWFGLFYLWHSLGITIGYHRLLAHRSARTSKPILYFFLAGAYLSLQGSPASWAATHRFHHQVTDTPEDPHTPRRGIWYALNGWVWGGQNPDLDYLVPDILRDPVLAWFGSGPLPSRPVLNLSVVVGWRLLLWVLFGAEIALASLLAGFLAYWAPQLINTFCHWPAFFGSTKVAYRNHDTDDQSLNVPILNWITMGEALHNNHHAFPSRLSQAEPGEFDFSYQVCRLLRAVGLMRF